MNRFKPTLRILKTTFSKGVAGFVVGSVTLNKIKNVPVVYAEEQKRKLKIYDDPKPEIIIVKTPTKLEQGIRHTRLQVSQVIRDLEQHIRNVTDQWIDIEQNTEREIKSVIAPNERLMPDVLYVVVAGLAGNLVARNFIRNSNIFVRITSPVLFTIVSSYYFLPQTSRNIMAKLCEYEKRSPELMKIHNSVSDVANNTKQKFDSVIINLKNITGDRTRKSDNSKNS
ncbi:apolipo protein O-domain-containing protein [Gigaspora rosea]|uniref:MICOS complex subunit n=1 Tax=Gigaspora rosea TaxID=44941 RepID=A0A397VU34_9GLOM|nr:apolipo protein O-domain-containing protein [Gigaspora rosea]